MIIRVETPSDFEAIFSVTKSAFPKPDEAELVNRLRADGDSVISLVALKDNNLVGHVLLSKLDAPFKALGLAPVSVSPEFQGHGIGSALIKEAIKQAAQKGWRGIFVLGDPHYYQRFGFDPALASGFSSVYAGDHFMAMSLNGEFPVRSGEVAYAPAFAALE